MKKCTKCNETKSKSEFGNHKLTKDKLQCHCKLCINLASSKHKATNPEWSREHYISRQDHYKNKSSERYANNREEIISKQSEYYFKNKEQRQEYYKSWVSRNKSELNLYNLNRKKDSPTLRLSCTLRSHISTYTKNVSGKKNKSTLDIVGFDSWEDFREYIQSQFSEGMSWDNYGIGANNSTWHIDHIIPISSAKTLEEVKKLNHHNNLRPMWGSDNIRKSNKMLGD